MLAGSEREVSTPRIVPTPAEIARQPAPIPLQVWRNERGYRIGEAHHRAKYSNERYQLAMTLHDQGWGRIRIAKKLGVPASTVSRWLDCSSRAQLPRERED